MSQDDMTKVLSAVREGETLTVSYDSPRGERRFGIRVTSVKRDPKGRILRVGLERGTAVWMFLQQKKVDDDEQQWYIFQPNPYPIYEVGLEKTS